jgi:hypothetical protein
MISKAIANLGSLAVVATAHPEHVGAAFVGQLCARRARGDLENPRLFVDFRCRDRGVRAEVPDNEHDAIARQATATA